MHRTLLLVVAILVSGCQSALPEASETPASTPGTAASTTQSSPSSVTPKAERWETGDWWGYINETERAYANWSVVGTTVHDGRPAVRIAYRHWQMTSDGLGVAEQSQGTAIFDEASLGLLEGPLNGTRVKTRDGCALLRVHAPAEPYSCVVRISSTHEYRATTSTRLASSAPRQTRAGTFTVQTFEHKIVVGPVSSDGTEGDEVTETMEWIPELRNAARYWGTVVPNAGRQPFLFELQSYGRSG